MVSYDLLVFSQDLFKDKVINIYDKALDKAVEVIKSNEYFANGTVNIIEIFSTSSGYDKYVEVTATDIKAWIVEYGQGKAADTTRNPYWEEYVESGLTSPDRTDGTVLRRGADPYESIDFKKGKLREHARGSEPAGTSVSNRLQNELSIAPTPFLQSLLEQAYKVFQKNVDSAMSNFDISTCYITSQINL